MVAKEIELEDKFENMGVQMVKEVASKTSEKAGDATTIVKGAGQKPDIEGRLKQLRLQIDETTSDSDREKLQERLAKVVGGVAVIRIGAATETEMKQRKARGQDALIATVPPRKKESWRAAAWLWCAVGKS